jgi:acyl carrier protein
MSAPTFSASPRVSAPAPDVSYRRVVRVSAPLVLSSVTSTGSTLVATGLIAQIGGSALYVRSVYAPVAFLFLAVGTGLSVTLQVAVAQCRGRGEETQIRYYFGGVARAGALAYLILGVTLLASTRLLAAAVRLAPGREAAFHEFLIAMAGAMLLGMLGDLCSATLRGLGRTGTGAVVTAVYVTFYLGSIGLVGLVLHGGLMAVALGVALAGVVEICIGLTVMVRRGVLDLGAFAAWRPDVPRLLAAIGLPVGVSFLVLCVVNLVLLHIVAPAGQHAVAGFNVGYTLQTAIILPAVGLGSAVSVLMNQAVAAGSVRAARMAFRRGMVLAAGGYAAATVAVLIIGGPAVDLMSGDPATAEQAREFVLVVGPTFGCTGLVLTAVTILEQVGYGKLAAATNLGYFGAVLAIGWAMVDSTGNIENLYRTMMIAAVASLIVSFPVMCAMARRPRALRPRALRREPAPRTFQPSGTVKRSCAMEQAVAVAVTAQDRLDEIAVIAADIFSVSAEQVTAAESFIKDLGTDSLLTIELLTRLEKQYDIHIPDTEVPRMTNLRHTYEVAALCAGW